VHLDWRIGRQSAYAAPDGIRAARTAVLDPGGIARAPSDQCAEGGADDAPELSVAVAAALRTSSPMPLLLGVGQADPTG
jgi:hypothetical protein